MRSCNTGELCVVFVCGSRSSCHLFLFHFTRCALNLLCLDLRVPFFLLYMYLVRYILTPRMQRTHTALGRFGQFLFRSASFSSMFFPVCYPFAVSVLCRQYSVVSTLSYRCTCTLFCVVSMLFLCFGWCLCIFGEAMEIFSCDCF